MLAPAPLAISPTRPLALAAQQAQPKMPTPPMSGGLAGSSSQKGSGSARGSVEFPQSKEKEKEPSKSDTVSKPSGTTEMHKSDIQQEKLPDDGEEEEMDPVDTKSTSNHSGMKGKAREMEVEAGAESSPGHSDCPLQDLADPNDFVASPQVFLFGNDDPDDTSNFGVTSDPSSSASRVPTPPSTSLHERVASEPKVSNSRRRKRTSDTETRFASPSLQLTPPPQSPPPRAETTKKRRLVNLDADWRGQ